MHFFCCGFHRMKNYYDFDICVGEASWDFYFQDPIFTNMCS